MRVGMDLTIGCPEGKSHMDKLQMPRLPREWVRPLRAA